MKPNNINDSMKTSNLTFDFDWNEDDLEQIDTLLLTSSSSSSSVALSSSSSLTASVSSNSTSSSTTSSMSSSLTTSSNSTSSPSSPTCLSSLLSLNVLANETMSVHQRQVLECDLNDAEAFHLPSPTSTPTLPHQRQHQQEEQEPIDDENDDDNLFDLMPLGDDDDEPAHFADTWEHNSSNNGVACNIQLKGSFSFPRSSGNFGEEMETSITAHTSIVDLDRLIERRFPKHVLEMDRNKFNKWKKKHLQQKLHPRLQKRLTQIRRKLHSRVYAKRARISQVKEQKEKYTELQRLRVENKQLHESEQLLRTQNTLLFQRMTELEQTVRLLSAATTSTTNQTQPMNHRHT